MAVKQAIEVNKLDPGTYSNPLRKPAHIAPAMVNSKPLRKNFNPLVAILFVQLTIRTPAAGQRRNETKPTHIPSTNESTNMLRNSASLGLALFFASRYATCGQIKP